MDSNYRRSDGALFRWLDPATPNLEIYRGGGKWELWSDTADWLYGTPLDEQQAAQAISRWDAKPTAA
jgi:hypothetical protein